MGVKTNRLYERTNITLNVRANNIFQIMEDSFHNDSQENLKNKSRMEITILDPFRQVIFFSWG